MDRTEDTLKRIFISQSDDDLRSILTQSKEQKLTDLSVADIAKAVIMLWDLATSMKLDRRQRDK